MNRIERLGFFWKRITHYSRLLENPGTPPEEREGHRASLAKAEAEFTALAQ